MLQGIIKDIKTWMKKYLSCMIIKIILLLLNSTIYFSHNFLQNFLKWNLLKLQKWLRAALEMKFMCSYLIHSLDTLLGTPCWYRVGPLLSSELNSSWHRFNKVLETFLRDFGPYWHDSITQLLQICRLVIHDENLSFLHIPKVLYWIEIWGLWRPFE